jgi:hypothetical protein
MRRQLVNSLKALENSEDIEISMVDDVDWYEGQPAWHVICNMSNLGLWFHILEQVAKTLTNVFNISSSRFGVTVGCRDYEKSCLAD